MSLFDRFVSKSKKDSTRRLIGAASLGDCCLVTFSGTKSAFLVVSPVNLNVVSPDIIRSLVSNLTKAASQIGAVEFLCLNSAQDYDSNKRYLHRRMAVEQHAALKEIDQLDIEFLDDIQVQMATSREFLLVLRFGARESGQQVSVTLDKARKIMAENGFTVRIADKAQIKKILAIYFEQNIYENEMQDFDGERFSPILEMKK